MANLKIVLCDTKESRLLEFLRICETVCKQAKKEVDVETFSDRDFFLQKMRNPTYRSAVDILIIDPAGDFEETETATATAVREFGYEWIIIYLSRSKDQKFLQQAFDNEAYNYCEKSNPDRFAIVLTNAIRTVTREKYPPEGIAFSWDLRKKRCQDQLVDCAAGT